MTSTTKTSALDFHDSLIAKKGVKNASGFSERGRNTRFEIIVKCLSDFTDPNLFLLDYGCNDGELYQVLLRIMPRSRISRYMGVDINPKFIQLAKERWHGHPVTFWVGNALEDTDHKRITQHIPDIIVASGTMCYKGAEGLFPELICRLYDSAKQGFIFNVLAADVPKEFMNPRLVKESKELYRWKVEHLLKTIQRTGCSAWDIRRSYLHNDITVILRKRWTHFR